MKIIHLLATNNYSGAENVVIQIIKMFEKNNDVNMLYIAKQGPIEKTLTKKNIKYVLLDKMSFKNIKQVIEKEKPDVIHAHDFTMSIIATRFKKNGITIISHLHHNPDWIKRKNIKSILYFLASKRIDKILVVSKSIKNEYIYANKIIKKIMVVGNPVDIRSLLNNEDNNIKKEIDILFVGRMTEAKNPLLFIEILKMINDKGIKVNSLMVGDGDLMEKVEDKIKKLKLENVRLTGFVRNPYLLMKKSKIICMPSKWEGFGLVAVEGLTFGIPIVASKVGGLVDIVNDCCGKLCESKKEYVDEIIKLLTEKSYYHNKSIQAKERANCLDNIEQYKSNLMKVYEIKNQ